MSSNVGAQSSSSSAPQPPLPPARTESPPLDAGSRDDPLGTDTEDERPDEASARDLLASSAHGESDRMPWSQLVPLYICMACERWNMDSVFSYVVFLVVDFTGLSINQAGDWAGLVASAYFVGTFITSAAWGWLSDRAGRKLLLILGSLGSLCSILVMGFSSSLGVSIAARFFAGALNGNLGITKSYIGEITNSKTQARAFSYLSVAWGLGSIFGSLVGGVLSRPALSWPVLQGTVFERWPYLLPNLVNAVVLVVGTVVMLVFLREPPRRKAASSQQLAASGETSARSPCSSALHECRSYVPLSVLLPVMGYAVSGTINTGYREATPLFLSSTHSVGGLSFDSKAIGLFNGIGAISSILFTVLGYNHIVSRFGLIQTYRVGCVGMAMWCVMIPYAGWLFSSPALLWVYLCILQTALTAASQCLFAAAFVLINNSCPTWHLGKVNGVSQSLVAFGRLLAPMIAGRTFAWSVSPPETLLRNIWLPFLGLGIGFGMAGLLAVWYSSKLDRPYGVSSASEEVELE